jgi:hypothetical protein
VGAVSPRGRRRGVPGGILTGDAVAVAATLAVLGLPVERYLTTIDHDERLVLAAIARKAFELTNTLQRNQAAHVVNALAKAMR